MSPPSEGMSCRDVCRRRPLRRVGAVGAKSSEDFSWGGGSVERGNGSQFRLREVEEEERHVQKMRGQLPVGPKVEQ